MVEVTTPQSQAEARRPEFVLGDIEAIKHDLKERGRFSYELTEAELEEVLPRVASEMTGEGKRPPRVHISIQDKSANLQINARIKGVVDVEANLVLENSQEREGEIVAREIKTNPEKWLLFNVQKQAEEWGGRINAELKDFFGRILEEQGARITGVKFRFTEKTLRIEAEDEERLKELEAQIISPERMEIISPPPPEPPQEPQIVPVPVIIDVIPKEVVQEKRPRRAETSLVPPSANRVPEQKPPKHPEESLKNLVAREKEGFDEVVEGYLGGELNGEEFGQIVDVYAESLIGINKQMNFQIDPDLQRGRIGERYWVSNDRLVSLEKELGEKTTPLGRKIVALEDYVGSLRRRTEDFEALKKRLGIKGEPQKAGEAGETGKTPMQVFIERVRERRENVEDAWLNLEEARRAEKGYQSHRRTVIGPTPTYRIIREEKGYEPLLETAVREQETSLFAFSRYLERMVATKNPADDPGLFERYRGLGEELRRLSQEGEGPAQLPEERMWFLKEYDRVLDERLRVCLELSRQRGLDLLPQKYELRTLSNPDGKKIRVEVRTTKPQLDLPNASLVEVRAGGEKAKTTTLIEVEAKGERAHEATRVWADLRKMEVPVVQRVSTITYEKYDEAWKQRRVKTAILYSDLTNGGRNEVFDFSYLHLLKENHGEDFRLPEPFKQEGRRIVGDLLKSTEVAAGGLGEEPEKRRYKIPPEAVRFVIDPSKKTVDVVIYDLLAVLTPFAQDDNLDWIKNNAIALGFISEEDWERLQEPMKKAA